MNNHLDDLGRALGRALVHAVHQPMPATVALSPRDTKAAILEVATGHSHSQAQELRDLREQRAVLAALVTVLGLALLLS